MLLSRPQSVPDNEPANVGRSGARVQFNYIPCIISFWVLAIDRKCVVVVIVVVVVVSHKVPLFTE